MFKVISVTMILMAMSVLAFAVEVENKADCPFAHVGAPNGPVAQNALNTSRGNGALTYQNSDVQNPNPAVNGNAQGEQ